MTENIKVAISSDFLTSFARLPRQIQGKVTEFVNKFRNNPLSPGINYEKINSGVDKKIYSVRIDDTYRGIVVRQEETGDIAYGLSIITMKPHQWLLENAARSTLKPVLFRCSMFRRQQKRYLHLKGRRYLLLHRMMSY